MEELSLPQVEPNKDVSIKEVVVFDINKLPLALQRAIEGARQSAAYAKRHNLIKPLVASESQVVLEPKTYE